MSWRFEFFSQKGQKYGRFKRNIQKKGKRKSEYVYLGEEKVALKIYNDLNSRKCSEEQCFSFTGEQLLKEIANRLKFKSIVNRWVDRKNHFNIGEFLEILVIERALNPASKWSLAQRIHKTSVLSTMTSIPDISFSEENIYNYMDYFHSNIHQIQNDLIGQLYKIFPSESESLILDGTSISAHKADSDPNFPDEEETSAEDPSLPELPTSIDFEQEINRDPILRFHGYNREKRPDLPQINAMLGVNQRYIPLYFEVYAGNTQDLSMFQGTLARLHTTYTNLLNRMTNKFIIFDRGNINQDNIDRLEKFKQNWGVYFIGGLKSSLVKDELSVLESDNLPPLFMQGETQLYGKKIKKTLYNHEYTVLLYVSKSVRKHKILKFQKSLETVLSKLECINTNSKLTNIEKVQEMRVILREVSMVQLFKLRKFDKEGNPTPPLRSRDQLYHLNITKVERKKQRFQHDNEKMQRFINKLAKVASLLSAINNQTNSEPCAKVQEMKTVLKNYSMVQLYWLRPFTDEGKPDPSFENTNLLYQLSEPQVSEKLSLFGKFALISNTTNLSAQELMKYYKTKEVVEHEFHLLKELLKMGPFYHRLPHRIESHFAIVHWSMLFLSILHCYLENHGYQMSFEELLFIISKGWLRQTVYSYPEFKTLQITELSGITPTIKKFLGLLNISLPKFDIKALSEK